MYIIIGNLFLRGLLVKHAKYISLESHLNTLMVSDFGLPVWVSIITFCLLNILYLCLNSDFPFNFPNVRTCRGVATFRDNDHQDNRAVNDISRNFHNIQSTPLSIDRSFLDTVKISQHFVDTSSRRRTTRCSSRPSWA